MTELQAVLSEQRDLQRNADDVRCEFHTERAHRESLDASALQLFKQFNGSQAEFYDAGRSIKKQEATLQILPDEFVAGEGRFYKDVHTHLLHTITTNSGPKQVHNSADAA